VEVPADAKYSLHLPHYNPTPTPTTTNIVI
jgi:hypothetical protein